ncbi:hypothetical protein TIFTF001_039758 [Ficus carica]|uniref:Uncharacterized protein n=1 Tax=Ficus carica TaxID=3494 RepID=A0AA88CH29_FICCA|nr:hypothetical protein TIFTF001_039758 [Ficus carica]
MAEANRGWPKQIIMVLKLIAMATIAVSSPSPMSCPLVMSDGRETRTGKRGEE